MVFPRTKSAETFDLELQEVERGGKAFRLLKASLHFLFLASSSK